MFTPPVPSAHNVIPLLDHTLLKPDAGRRAIEQLCREARYYGFASVCVLPRWLPLAVEGLSGSTVAPGTVVGFPLGANAPSIKAAEAEWAVQQGARELDMVLALGALKDGEDEAVGEDIAGVVNAAGSKAIVKVILETPLLTPDEIERSVRLATQAGAAFVKTCTGFFGGATVDAVRLMRRTAPPSVGVKASGGIRTLAEAWAMIQAGANRIGTSAAVAIATGTAP